MKPSNAHRCTTFVASLAFLISSGAVSHGLGFRIPDQNAEATARGNAFTATADNPSAVFYNPAGITQLEGTRVLLGAYAISLKERVDLLAPGENSEFSSTNTDLQAVPTFYVTWKPKQYPIALGLGVYMPYGFAIEYPDDTPFRTLAVKGSIQYLTINPVIAWKITDTFSVAAGPTVSFGEAELVRGIVNAGDQFKFKGDGVAYGFNAGLMWNPHRMHHFGLTYRSAAKIDFSGYSSVSVDSFNVATPFGPLEVPGTETRENADAAFDLPQNFVFGYSFRPTEDWNFEFNIDWTDWDSLNTVTLSQSSGNVPLPFNWESSFFYEFGVTKKFAHGISASVGYIYSENSVPNESFSPAIPDSNRHIYSAGVGQRYTHFNWFLAYQYAYGPSRTIAQNTVADGDYRFDSHAVTLSLGYNF
jgi:long-chain fatty acid transport protein